MGWDMLIGRFLMMIPVLALAGNLAQKKSVPPSPGTFPVNTPLFTVLLVGVMLDRRRAHILPGAEPGTDSRTPAAASPERFSNREQPGERTDMAEKTSLWNTEIMRQALDRLAFASSIRAGWSRTR